MSDGGPGDHELTYQERRHPVAGARLQESARIVPSEPPTMPTRAVIWSDHGDDLGPLLHVGPTLRCIGSSRPPLRRVQPTRRGRMLLGRLRWFCRAIET